VVADSRAPRDGRYIERIGSYNPITNPATIELDVDRALYWLSVGAQPTDTTRRILAYEGVLLKKHLMGGVKKGAFDEATANAKFEEWKKEKLAKIQAQVTRLTNESESQSKARLQAEIKIKEAKAEIVAKKLADIAEAKAKAAAEARAEADAAATEAIAAAETPAAETPAVEAPVAEAPAAEVPVVEVSAAEAPAGETPVVEAPAAE
jgi:small subunit ribosomal protein S16